MPVVRVDDDVWNWLKSHATPFETPNSVLRRLAGLDRPKDGRAHPASKRRRREATASTKNDYIVTKSPDKHGHWWFQIYQRKLARKALRGDFSIVVVCDRGAPSEVVFRVPYAYLRDNILPKAKLELDKRYMFEVKKDSHEFVFHPGIRFKGNRFQAKR
jgi:hypothetical protein